MCRLDDDMGDEDQMTTPDLSEPLASGVGLDAFVSGNASNLTAEEIQRLITENSHLLTPKSSNFDFVTQVRYNL